MPLLTFGTLTLAFALALALALPLPLLAFGPRALAFALTLPLTLPWSLAFAARTALSLAGTHLPGTASIEIRTAGATGSRAEPPAAGAGLEAGPTREGSPAVEPAQALAPQHLQPTLAPQFRPDQHAADDAAHHRTGGGLSGIAILRETPARGGE